MAELAITMAPTGSPRSPDEALAAELNAARSRLDGGVLVGGLHPDQRALFAGRLAELQPYFQPAKREEIEDAINNLMVSFFPARSVSAIEARVTLRKYSEDLAGMPLWAIRGACSAISQGKVDGASIDFAPAAPRIRSAAGEIMTPFLAEQYHLKMVLRAREEREVSPEERRRVLEGLRLLGKALTATSRSEREAEINKSVEAFRGRHAAELERIPDLPQGKSGEDAA